MGLEHVFVMIHHSCLGPRSGVEWWIRQGATHRAVLRVLCLTGGLP
jgi:hypothetical protein